MQRILSEPSGVNPRSLRAMSHALECASFHADLVDTTSISAAPPVALGGGGSDSAATSGAKAGLVQLSGDVKTLRLNWGVEKRRLARWDIEP